MGVGAGPYMCDMSS